MFLLQFFLATTHNWLILSYLTSCKIEKNSYAAELRIFDVAISRELGFRYGINAVNVGMAEASTIHQLSSKCQ